MLQENHPDMSKELDIFASVAGLFESVFRHKWKLIAYNILVVLSVIALMLFCPRKYGSEAKVWLKLGRQNTRLDPTASTGQTIGIQKVNREDEIKSVLDVIASRGVLQEVVNTLTPDVVLGDAPLEGQEVKPPGKLSALLGPILSLNPIDKIDPISRSEKAIREIEKNVEVNAERKSNVVAVSYAADSPALAQAVVNEILTAYKARHNEIHRVTGSQSFFAEQKGLLQNRVDHASKALKQAKDEIGIASIVGQKASLEDELLGVEKERLATTQKLAESNAMVAELKKLLESNPEYVQSEQRSVPNTGRDALRSRLWDLQSQRMQLEQTYNEDNPLVQAAKAQEAKAAELLNADSSVERSETIQALNKIHQDLSLDLAKAKASIAGYNAMLTTLGKQETELRERMSNLNTYDIRIKQLERELQLAEANFMSYSEKYEDARVDEALNLSAISNLGIAQEPTFQERPVSPSKFLLALLGIAAMGAGTVALTAFLHTVIDRDVLDEREVEEIRQSTSIPVIVSIPERLAYQKTLR